MKYDVSHLEKWLNELECTEPFTLDDAKEIQKMLREALAGFERVATEVVIYGKRVEVAVWIAEKLIRRTYDVR